MPKRHPGGDDESSWRSGKSLEPRVTVLSYWTQLIVLERLSSGFPEGIP